MYQIAELAKAKEIKYLVHFTRVENLPSIALYGLISRQLLVQNNLPHFYNDNLRLDNLPNTISLSVTFPNYKMFFKYRGSNKWVVILLNAYKILEKFECIFNYTNAANHEIRDTDIEQRKGIAAFQYMFYNTIDDIRGKCNLLNCETTDPQAEILCLNPISTDFF